ncbi:hypothetical protein E4U09_001319 [Claviceps aff. purpurea]|uniref:Uncharacterized protein n=1 Tax=Claviceps aff. purpurea TaxID=1967640 RepID=A0A9P7QJF6_9HYPO|nr:hypothetical protein E4U09_001319 [Claviceps aff. purpurea]
MQLSRSATCWSFCDAEQQCTHQPYPQVMIHSDLEFANEKLKRVETEQNGQAQARDEATGSADGTESAQTPADANANGAPLGKARYLRQVRDHDDDDCYNELGYSLSNWKKW